MSIQERGLPRVSSSFFTEVDEKEQNFRRYASDGEDMDVERVHSRAARHEAAFKEEAVRRQVAEATARDLSKQLEKMRRSLEDCRLETQSSASIAEHSLEELMEMTERLTQMEESTDVASAAATSFHHQCEMLLRELEQKNSELQQERTRAETLEQQLAELQDDVKHKQIARRQLRYELQDVYTQVEMTMERNYGRKEHAFQKLLNEVSAQNIKHLEKHRLTKDSEISRLRQELKKEQSIDQDLHRKVTRLEFCLGEAQRQIEKLRRILEEEGNQTLPSQTWLQQAKSSTTSSSPSFWSNSKLPWLLSMSAFALLFIIKR